MLTDRGANVTLVQPEQRGDFNDVLQEMSPKDIYQPFKEEIAKHLSQNWLDAWEKGERMVLPEAEILSTIDRIALKEIYRENHQERREVFNTFVGENARSF